MLRLPLTLPSLPSDSNRGSRAAPGERVAKREETREGGSARRAPRPVRAVLMMTGAAEIDGPGLASYLNAEVRPLGLKFRRGHSRSGMVFCAGSVHLTVTGQAIPWQSAALRAALASDFGRLLGDNWEDRAARHTGAVVVEARTGAAEDGLLEALRDPDEVERRGRTVPAADEAHVMRAIAHAGISQLTICNRAGAAAVLWEPSQQLFAPDRFLAMLGMQNPLPLYLHPVPHHAGRTEDGTPILGLDFAGAEEVLGHRMAIRPAAAPLSWMTMRAYALVSHERATGERLRHGDSFGTGAGERIGVLEDEDGARTLVVMERDGRAVAQGRSTI